MDASQNYFSNVSNFSQNTFTAYNFCALGWAGVFMPVATTFGILGLGVCIGVYITCLRGKITSEDRGDLLVFNTILTVMILCHLWLTNAQIAGACSWITLHPAICKIISWIKSSACTSLNVYLLFMSQAKSALGKIGERGVLALRLYGLVTICFMLHPLITVTSGSVKVGDSMWTEVCRYSSYAVEIECLDFSLGTVLPLLLTSAGIIHAFVAFSLKTKELNKPQGSRRIGSTRSTKRMATRVHRTVSDPSSSASGHETDKNSATSKSSVSRRTKSHLDATHTDLQAILQEIEKRGIFRKRKETLAFLTLFTMYIVLLMPCRISDFALIVFNEQMTGLSLGARVITTTIDYIGVIIDQLILLCPFLFPCFVFPLSLSVLKGWTICNAMCGVRGKREREIRRQVPILKRDQRRAEMEMICEEQN